MPRYSLGSNEVAFALGALAFLSFAFMLYAQVQRKVVIKLRKASIVRHLIRWITWLSWTASIVGWGYVLTAIVIRPAVLINPWVVAICATLVSSPLSAMYRVISFQEKAE